MVLSLLIGILAGIAARRFQAEVTEFTIRHLDEAARPPAGDRRVLSFAVAVIFAATLASLLGEGRHAPLLLISATAAYFQRELREAVLARRG